MKNKQKWGVQFQIDWSEWYSIFFNLYLTVEEIKLKRKDRRSQAANEKESFNVNEVIFVDLDKLISVNKYKSKYEFSSVELLLNIRLYFF